MRLAWRHTWPGQNRKDYTATDPERPRLFARVYRTASHMTDAPWFFCRVDGRISPPLEGDTEGADGSR